MLWNKRFITWSKHLNNYKINNGKLLLLLVLLLVIISLFQNIAWTQKYGILKPKCLPFRCGLSVME